MCENLTKKPYFTDGITYTRNLILRGISTIYLIAFLSFYYQSPGLFGNNGILPARIQIEGIASNSIASIHKKPTLLHLAVYLGLDTEYMIDVLALLGALISFTGLISKKMCILPTFAALWSLYFSLIQITQNFVNQSDYLLLEVGFIVLIIAPQNHNRSSPTDKIGFVLLRWLLIRFLFESGEVKLASRCPNWWNFTALSYHFETMPLPTPLSWYSHNLPDNWLKVTNIFTNISELVCTWLFFFPHRNVRRYAFYWQIFLQINIILTGNYGFLNFLICVMLLSLLDDEYFLEKNSNRGIVHMAKVMVGFFLVFFAICYLFGNHIALWTLKEGHFNLLRQTIKPAPMMTLIILIATFLKNLVSHPAIIYTKSFLQKAYAVNTLIAFTIISIALATISMVPHGNLDTATNITNSDLGRFYQQVRRYHIINEYGQHLRKMRTNRYEIIFEHAQSDEGPWKEYSFLYKPSNENQSLSFTGLYFARFDQKFYDAATSNYRNEPWIISLIYRLLQNEQNVLRLFGISTNITPAPKFVRASLYKFQYTSSAEKHAYWKRKRVNYYSPAYSLDNQALISQLRSMKISPAYQEPDVANKLLKQCLDIIRYQAHLFDGNFFIISVLSAGIAINILWAKKNKK